MSDSLNAVHRMKIAAAALIASTGVIVSADAQTPPAAPPMPVRQAIDVRKAVYTLIGNNFKPVGDVLQGRAQYDEVEVQKRVARVAFLAQLAGDAFPIVSNAGLPGTRAKAGIWNNRAEFDKRQQDFQEHAQALVQVAAREKGATDAFKAAAGAVAQDCKGCHDKFKEK